MKKEKGIWEKKESSRVKWDVKLPDMIRKALVYADSPCGYCQLSDTDCPSCDLYELDSCGGGNFKKVTQSLNDAIYYSEQMHKAIKDDMAKIGWDQRV